MSRFFVQDDPPAGLKLDEASDPEKVLELVRSIYPGLREVSRSEYEAAEHRLDTDPEPTP